MFVSQVVLPRSGVAKSGVAKCGVATPTPARRQGSARASAPAPVAPRDGCFGGGVGGDEKISPAGFFLPPRNEN
jgi:hypothetical protein